MLTREILNSDQFREILDTLPEDLRWSRQRIMASLAETVRSRPKDMPVWIFGYGSLLWNPLLRFSEKRVAMLNNWHRSFCLRMTAGRGSPAQPGRMLSLEPGGQTMGLAFCLDESTLDDELLLLWTREMSVGAYRPLWTEITFADGSEVTALAFVSNPEHPFFETDSAVDVVAPAIGMASGPLGTNADYVKYLEDALVDLGLFDQYVSDIAQHMKIV